jgi:hypothetical protein
MSDKYKHIEDSIKEKYPDVGIKSIEVDDTSGKATFYIEPTKKALAFLDKDAVRPRVFQDRASVLERDYIQRSVLDLALKKDAYTMDPIEAYKLADKYYYTDPMVGATVNVLAGLACKGFENDIDDEKIKEFFDNWCLDVGLEEVLEWIFLDFFKIGHVTTYKVTDSYEPGISYIGPYTHKETASTIKSKGPIPVAYTVLNPQLVRIQGSLLFDKITVALKPPKELSTLLEKDKKDLSDDEKELIKMLPSDLKKAIKEKKDYVLDSKHVGQITYRKQPYERYGRPRASRIFDTINYKKSLKEADISTLDGITNYILKITIGNDEYPVTSQEELETVAKMFDTPNKSFDVVWNHTLQIEKIVSPEIDKILGKGKYDQVNDDMSVGLAISRAIIDGGGKLNGPEAELLIKGITVELDYSRKQVEKWIYREYKQIAEVMGFDRYPKVRWDEGILLDTILYMNTLAQLVDRRMLSYRTALEALGFDFPNELRNMKEEVKIVEDGIFGVVGSPWQKAKQQPNQNAPEGTPSHGRPPGAQAPAKNDKKTPAQKPSDKLQVKKVQKTASVDFSIVEDMDDSQFEFFLSGAKETLDEENYKAFVEYISLYRR